MNGCPPLFQLLERLPRNSRLDNVDLLRSLYRDETEAVEEGWSDWFKELMKLQSNENRCKIFDATFRIIPELTTQKVVEAGDFGTDLSPLLAMISMWPAESLIPIELLDKLKEKMAETQKKDAVLSQNDPLQLYSIRGFRLFQTHIFNCKCSNKNDVAMWAIRNKIWDGNGLEYGISHGYSLEVVMAAARALVSKPNHDTIFARVLDRVLSWGEPYLDESLLRFLWRNSGPSIDLSLSDRMPDWFRDFVVSEARTVAKINLKWGHPDRDEHVQEPELLVLPTLRAMQGNSTLTKLHIHCEHDETDECVDALHDVLADCTSLEDFSFIQVYDPDGHSLVRIPRMPKLDKLHLMHALLLPESLEATMSTAREISIMFCELRFPTGTRGIVPDCYEGWARGLANNSRIEELNIERTFATGEFGEDGRSHFLRTLCSRPNLKCVQLDWREGPISFEFTPEEVGLFGTITALETLSLYRIPPDGLKNLLAARPFNLRRLHFGQGRVSMTRDDFLGLLDFLAHEKCRLETFWGYLSTSSFGHLAAAAAEAVDERLEDPVRALLNVLRDENSSLTDTWSYVTNGELDFWGEMNKTCPNRLDLRKELSDAYADQIAKYLNEDSHSEAFELVRSTFHLW